MQYSIQFSLNLNIISWLQSCALRLVHRSSLRSLQNINPFTWYSFLVLLFYCLAFGFECITSNEFYFEFSCATRSQTWALRRSLSPQPSLARPPPMPAAPPTPTSPPLARRSASSPPLSRHRPPELTCLTPVRERLRARRMRTRTCGPGHTFSRSSLASAHSVSSSSAHSNGEPSCIMYLNCTTFACSLNQTSGELE